MTHGEQLAPATPDFCVTFRRQTQEFEVVPEVAITPGCNYPGDPALPPSAVAIPRATEIYRAPHPSGAAQIYESFSRLYLALGAGWHTPDEVKQTLGLSWWRFCRAAERSQTVLPPYVIHVENTQKASGKYVYFGNLALTTALGGIGEREQRRRDGYFHNKINKTDGSITTSNGEIAVAHMRARVQKADRKKRQLFKFDHAVIQLGLDDVRYIALDSLENVLLLRTLQSSRKAARVPVTKECAGTSYRKLLPSTACDDVWATMPVAERRRIISDPFVLYGDRPPRALEELLRYIWPDAAKALSGEKCWRPSASPQVIFEDRPLTTRYCTHPPEYRTIQELCVSAHKP